MCSFLGMKFDLFETTNLVEEPTCLMGQSLVAWSQTNLGWNPTWSLFDEDPRLLSISLLLRETGSMSPTQGGRAIGYLLCKT